MQSPGIADMINKCLDKVEREHVLPLLQNIIITGGTTMFAGLATRMQKELAEVLTQ